MYHGGMQKGGGIGKLHQVHLLYTPSLNQEQKSDSQKYLYSKT